MRKFSGLSDKVRQKSYADRATKTDIFFYVKCNKNFFKITIENKFLNSITLLP